MRRSLVLKRETLTELSAGELADVNGGSHLCTVTHGPSFDQQCPTQGCPIPTLPIAICTGSLTQRGCPTISPDWCIWETR